MLIERTPTRRAAAPAGCQQVDTLSHMGDPGTLWINFGMLVAGAGAAAVAWWQAIEAGRGKVAAEKARDLAVAARQDAAKALTEANRIAGDARDILRAREARDTERHHVEWRPHWSGREAKFLLGNHGPDIAYKVRITIESESIGRVTEEDAELAVDRGLSVEFPKYLGHGGTPWVRWKVDWESRSGAQHHATGVYPPTR